MHYETAPRPSAGTGPPTIERIGTVRIAIIGPGAMGCLFGGLLARAGHEVIFLDRDPGRARAISRSGVRLEGISGKFRVRARATASPAAIEDPDLTLVCVKAYDTQEAARSAAGLLKRSRAVLTLQNGLGNVEALQKSAGRDRVIGGTTAHGATLLGAGHVRHAGAGLTILGEPSGGITVRLRRIAAVFRQAGLQVRLTRDLQSVLWNKLIVNCAINPLGALTGLPNGALPRHSGTRTLLRQAAQEAAAVARAMHVKVTASPARKVETVCRQTAPNLNSMLQDVLRHRRTEVEAINGIVVQHGRRLGIPTPVNATLAALVQAIQDSYADRIVCQPALTRKPAAQHRAQEGPASAA